MAVSNYKFIKEQQSKENKKIRCRAFYVENKPELNDHRLIHYYGKKSKMSKIEIDEFIRGNGAESLKLIKIAYLEDKIRLI
jgi:hypothetical protein